MGILYKLFSKNPIFVKQNPEIELCQTKIKRS
jgi:hypothetical protein